MSTPHVPRWAERLLESSGADAEFRDAVIGDLAEEFSIRARFDGERDARRWYAREALRTLPHLLRDGVWRLRHAGVRSLVIGTLKSYLAVTPFALLTAALIIGSAEALHLQLGASVFPDANRLLRDVGLPGLALQCAASAVFGGYVAARNERRAPLIGALALACAMCAVSIVASTVGTLFGGPVQPPSWWLMTQPLLLLVGGVAGGVLRAWTAAAVSTREPA